MSILGLIRVSSRLFLLEGENQLIIAILSIQSMQKAHG
jgi:hypothetical protein